MNLFMCSSARCNRRDSMFPQELGNFIGTVFNDLIRLLRLHFAPLVSNKGNLTVNDSYCFRLRCHHESDCQARKSSIYVWKYKSPLPSLTGKGPKKYDYTSSPARLDRIFSFFDIFLYELACDLTCAHLMQFKFFWKFLFVSSNSYDLYKCLIPLISRWPSLSCQVFYAPKSSLKLSESSIPDDPHESL